MSNLVTKSPEVKLESNLVTKSPEVERNKIKMLSLWILLLSILFIYGCGNHNLSGTYFKANGDTYVFYDTGTVKYDGKEKQYEYISDNIYVINPGENEKFARTSNDNSEMTITDAEGRFKLVNKMPSPEKVEKENKNLKENLKGRYITKTGEVEKVLIISDDVATIKSKSSGNEITESYIIEITDDKMRLSNANGIKGEYNVKLKRDNLILKNSTEKIVYEREK